MIRATVTTLELRRACKRLLSTSWDERDFDSSTITFTAEDDGLRIDVGESSEIISAVVADVGTESLPRLQFLGMAQTLRLFRKKKIEVSVGDNEITVERTTFRRPAREFQHNQS